jgi:hypothetical protein
VSVLWPSVFAPLELSFQSLPLHYSRPTVIGGAAFFLRCIDIAEFGDIDYATLLPGLGAIQ